MATTEELFSTITGDNRDSRADYILKAVDAVFSNTNMELRSVLEPDQILQIARGWVYAEFYNDSTMRAFLDILIKLPVSKRGRGRNDMVQAIKSALEKEENKLDESTLRQKLLGG